MEDGSGGDGYALDEMENVNEQDRVNWVRDRGRRLTEGEE